MSSEDSEVRLSNVLEVTDYVANGSFAALKENVTYQNSGFAILARLVDHNAGWTGPHVFVDEAAYKFLSKSALQVGDIVIANVGANAGTVFRIPSLGKPVTLGPNAVRIRPKNDSSTPINADFLYYYLSSPVGQEKLLSLITGSAQPKFNKTSLRGLSLRFPDISQQERIAEMMLAIDDRITLLRETNATLEAIAQARFKSWFVDFDPVRAKMEGRAPEGMGEATAALFPDSFEETELGLVPKGWKVGTLADLSALNPESWTERTHPPTIAYVDLANAKDNEISTVSEFVFSDAPSRARRVLRTGDTIVGTVRPGNRSFAFIHDPIENLTGSTGFAVLRPTKSENIEYVFLAATQDTSIERLAHVADGGAYPAVRPDVVIGLSCIIPTDGVLQHFHGLTEPLLIKVSENQKQAQVLVTVLNTLLPRLISGKIQLNE